MGYAVTIKISYDRFQLKPGVVHIGVGNFARAHQFDFFDRLARQGLEGWENWGVVGVSLRNTDVRDSLKDQDFTYNILTQESGANSIQPIGILMDVVHAPTQQREVLTHLVGTDLKAITTTVTENGYCLKNGELDFSHPDIAYDLANLNEPKTVIGFLAHALIARWESGLPQPTIICCDNIQHNGDMLRKAVMAFIRKAKPSADQMIADIEGDTAFPNSMVDRIVPGTTQVHRDLMQSQFGITDQSPVPAEGFTQWVVENIVSRGNTMPPLDRVGVEFVDDVGPHETMKLRLLNASHLFMATLAFVAGIPNADDAMNNPTIATATRRLMDVESTPTLTPIPGVDFGTYKDTLIRRFQNTAVKDSTHRISTDAPLDTLLAVTRDRVAAGESIFWCATGIAAWIRYVRGVNEAGESYQVKHPMAAELKAAACGENPVEAVMSITKLFGNLSQDANLVATVKRNLASLERSGSIQGLKTLLATEATISPAGKAKTGEGNGGNSH